MTASSEVISGILSAFPCGIATPDEAIIRNIRSAMARGLKEVKFAKPHDRIMSIAAGGPSLGDTWQDLESVICSVNASLGFLLDRGVTPWACGIFDPHEHMADLVEPHPNVWFFLGSTCHPRLFDKLKDCKIALWHPLGMPEIEDVAAGSSCFVGGGSTMGLRWLNLGYVMGFRRFHMHGLDSSFRGDKTHAYADYRDGMKATNLAGYSTSLNFIKQVDDWFRIKSMFGRMPKEEQPSIKLFGDGLLQHMENECST